MSTAHRPTWDPAQAKDVKGGSRQYSSRDMASQTKLKFRQPGQTSVGDVAKRDLRMDLLLAEHEAKNRKRKAAGQDPLPLPAALTGATATPVAAIENGSTEEEEAASKRRKMLQEVMELDKDDDEEEEDKAKDKGKDKGKGKASDAMDEDEDEDDEDDSDDDEDETAQLLAELEKIKRERAAEEERRAREISEGKARDREDEIAMGNPLLNLEAALGQGKASSGKPGTFAVKKRWDDDVIFKNQGAQAEGPPGHFVNDLLRTEFHKKFMAKFIK